MFDLSKSSNRNIAVAVAIVLIVIAAVVGVRSCRSESEAAPPVPVGKAWFTTDDGKTWFADDDNRLFPFDKDGKKAYRCYVWTCDGGKTKFVSHLERVRDPLWTQRQATGRL